MSIELEFERIDDEDQRKTLQREGKEEKMEGNSIIQPTFIRQEYLSVNQTPVRTETYV